MEYVSIRQLRDGLTGYLRRVQAGQSLIITDRGKSVAHLSPKEDVPAARSALERDGLVEWGSGKHRGALLPAYAQEGSVADLVIKSRR